jgi:hypothetical protein
VNTISQGAEKPLDFCPIQFYTVDGLGRVGGEVVEFLWRKCERFVNTVNAQIAINGQSIIALLL